MEVGRGRRGKERESKSKQREETQSEVGGWALAGWSTSSQPWTRSLSTGQSTLNSLPPTSTLAPAILLVLSRPLLLYSTYPPHSPSHLHTLALSIPAPPTRVQHPPIPPTRTAAAALPRAFPARRSAMPRACPAEAVARCVHPRTIDDLLLLSRIQSSPHQLFGSQIFTARSAHSLLGSDALSWLQRGRQETFDHVRAHSIPTCPAIRR
ncbi:hypothetical protein FKP32DRAFT_1247019 [Trametes sanguinea]|nr:hypothetical protein FKP32DRAFT_1247019 [Trametes sanguinea]